MKHIAVEKDLTPIKEYLEDKGYDIECFEGSLESACKQHKDLQAVVISGMNENVLGIEDTECKAVIIDARGMTPEEVEERLENEAVRH